MKINENSIYLTEEEAKEEVFEGEVIETIRGVDVRWGTHVETIVKIEGKFYSIKWVRAATEMQEHEFTSGDYPEVHEIEVTVKKWVPKQ